MKKFFRAIALLVLLAFLVAAWFCVSHRSLYFTSVPPVSHSLTVLTLNTQTMGWAAKAEDNKVIRYLRQSDADVMCLQEVLVRKSAGTLTLNELKRAFPDYPYTYFDFKVYNRYKQFGNVVFSKYPLLNKHTIRYDSRSNITSCCDINVQGDTLRLFINHLESNKIREDIDSAMLNRSFKDSPMWEKIRSAGTIRLRQAQTVNDSVQASPYPVIVVGDFNDIPLSRTYLKMCKGLKDCFLHSSNGRLGLTWVHSVIGLRIDYILCSRQLYPVSFTVDEVDVSDHYPCKTVITW